MAELRDSTLYVKFNGNKKGTDDKGVARKLNGTTNIEEWSIESNFLGSTDGFQFVIADDNPDNLRDLECQPVTLYVNGNPQLVGRIDSTFRGDRGSSVTCKGRDYIADLVESNIDPSFIVKEGETLGDVILRATSPVGIKKLSDSGDVAAARNIRTGRAIGDLGPPPNFKGIKQEDMKPDPGQGIFEYLKKICERHGCMIKPDVSRDSILLTGPRYKQDIHYSITRLRGSTDKNNLDSATASRDYSSFPSLVIVQGHGSPRHGEATKTSQAIIDTWSEAQHFDHTGELGRILNEFTWSGRRKPGSNDGDLLAQNKIYRLNMFRDQQARTQLQMQKAATRLLNEHLKNTLVYEATVRGHIDPTTGAVWSVDTIVDVNDDICDVHEPLWVVERKLVFNSGGAKTFLKCIRPGSFEI